MSGDRFILPYAQVGAPPYSLPGALLNFYITGSSTRSNTYSNAALTIRNTNPVQADATGLFPSIFIDPSVTYKVVLTDRLGAQIWTADPVVAAGSGGGSGVSDFETIADAKVATLGSVTVIQVNRYAADREYYPTQFVITTAGVYNFTTNAGAKRWVISGSEVLAPPMFGSYGDGASHPIVPQDITDNPQWIGTYDAGTEWDTVATKESLLMAIAGVGSSPGIIVFNLSNNATNRRWFCSTGLYQINRQIAIAMSGFDFAFEDRLACRWLDNVPGGPCLLVDSGAYGVWDNLSVEVQSLKDQGEGSVSFDGSGQFGGLVTQQLTINNPVINCAFLADYGLVISNAGGNSQGDTIAINNHFITSALVGGGRIGPHGGSANNALSIWIGGAGNTQFCTTGWEVNGGSITSDDISFQPGVNKGSLGFHFTPVMTQLTTGGADYKLAGGGGATVRTAISNIRSEGSVAVLSPAGSHTNENYVTACADIEAAASYVNSYLPIGYGLNPSLGNDAVAVVDDGGPGVWYNVTQTGAQTILGPFATAWTVNQWAPGGLTAAGFICAFRFGSGFTNYVPIISNTATTITIAGAVSCNTSCMVRIIGRTAAVEPTWSSAVPATISQPYAVNGGFTTTQGSASISGSVLTNAIVGNYIFVQSGDRWGTSGEAQYPTCFVAKITVKPTATTATIDRVAPLTLVDATGFVGAGFANGDYKMLRLPFTAMSGAIKADAPNLPLGYMRLIDAYNDAVANVDTTFPGASHKATLIPGYAPRNTWTPTVTAQTTPPSGPIPTYNEQTGFYRLINGEVVAEFQLSVATVGAGAVGSFLLDGLPFPLPASGAIVAAVSVSNFTYGAGAYCTLVGRPGTTQMWIQVSTNAGAVTKAAYSGLNGSGSTVFQGSIRYSLS